jgi:hypothetical protein
VTKCYNNSDKIIKLAMQEETLRPSLAELTSTLSDLAGASFNMHKAKPFTADEPRIEVYLGDGTSKSDTPLWDQRKAIIITFPQSAGKIDPVTQIIVATEGKYQGGGVVPFEWIFHNAFAFPLFIETNYTGKYPERHEEKKVREATIDDLTKAIEMLKASSLTNQSSPKTAK